MKSPIVEYNQVETVKARRLDDAGEHIVTTSHGPVFAYGGYIVYTKDGRVLYMETDKFEETYEIPTVYKAPAKLKK